MCVRGICLWWWGEARDPDSVPDCVLPTQAAPNSGCDSVYPGMKSGGVIKPLPLSLAERALAVGAEPGGETGRARPLAVILIMGRPWVILLAG